MVCKSSLFLSWLLHKNIKGKMRIYVTRYIILNWYCTILNLPAIKTSLNPNAFLLQNIYYVAYSLTYLNKLILWMRFFLNKWYTCNLDMWYTYLYFTFCQITEMILLLLGPLLVINMSYLIIKIVLARNLELWPNTL